jgi:hypothetical protein
MQNNMIIQVENAMNGIMLQNLGHAHQHLSFTADALSAFEDTLSAADTDDFYGNMPELQDFDFDIN